MLFAYYFLALLGPLLARADPPTSPSISCPSIAATLQRRERRLAARRRREPLESTQPLLLPGPDFPELSFESCGDSPFGSRCVEFSVMGPGGRRVILLPFSLDASSQQLSHEAKTSGRVWEGAVVLGKYLERQCGEGGAFSSLSGKRVLELGGGVAGLVGQVAGALGAHVVITDLPSVVPITRLNVRHNFPSAPATSTAATATAPAVQALDWASVTSPTTCAALLCSLSSTFTALAAYNTTAPRGVRGSGSGGAGGEGRGDGGWEAGGECCVGLDLLVAADVVWVEGLIEPFVATMACLTLLPTGATGAMGAIGAADAPPAVPPRVLLSHRHRTDRTDALLRGELKRHGLQLRLVPRQSHHPQFAREAIDIYSVERSVAAEEMAH